MRRLENGAVLRGWMTALGLLYLGSASAADHSNLEAGFPVTVEDAYPIKYRSLELQGLSRWDRVDGDDRIVVEPRIEYGLLRNLQATIGAPYRFGDAEDAHEGEASAEALYNFNSEGIVLPAVSVGVGVRAPFDTRDDGLESEVKGVLTKSLGSWGTRYIPRQVHFNASWRHKDDALPGDRSNRDFIGIGYSQAVSNEVVMVFDAYRKELALKGSEEKMAEIGLRIQLDPHSVLSFGAGAGLNDESPDARVLVGYQRTLSWPYRQPR